MDNKYFDLSKLTAGHSGIVISLPKDRILRQRLLSFGLNSGCRITALFSAPFGDTAAYSFKDTVLALRSSDSAQIIISEDNYDI